MLNADASSLYYELTIIEHDIGLIGASEWMYRMAFLSRFGGDGYSQLGVGISEEYFDENEPDGTEWAVEESKVLENHPRRKTSISDGYLQPPEPLLMKFCSSSISGGQVSGARIWQFHQADVDPYPSVPHGHEAKGPKKLDAYRGTVFLKREKIGKEPNRLIVALWNDLKFRDFARKAIIWYMAEFPWSPWRVRNPLRLPRRR